MNSVGRIDSLKNLNQTTDMANKEETQMDTSSLRTSNWLLIVFFFFFLEP